MNSIQQVTHIEWLLQNTCAELRSLIRESLRLAGDHDDGARPLYPARVATRHAHLAIGAAAGERIYLLILGVDDVQAFAQLI